MTKVYFDPECSRIFGLPLGEPERAAREALRITGRDGPTAQRIADEAQCALTSQEGCAGDDWTPVVGSDAVMAWLAMLLPTAIGVGGVALWFALK